MSLKIFFHNLRYLFRYNLKDLYNNLQDIDKSYISRYELISEYLSYTKPKIKNCKETIDTILSKNASIGRFGDGEYELMQNNSIHFQKADNKLAQRLTEVLTSNEENFMVCINQFWEKQENILEYSYEYSKMYISKKLRLIDKFIDRNKQYYISSFTQKYMPFDVDDEDCNNYFNHMKEIWQNRDITIICGKGILDNLEHNIFDCAKSIEYMYAPSKNAFNDYENILESAQRIPKSRMIIIILGPTATILAYDMHKLGYQALDMGHCAKDYNAYKTKLEKNLKNCYNFYAPD